MLDQLGHGPKIWRVHSQRKKRTRENLVIRGCSAAWGINAQINFTEIGRGQSRSL